MIGGRLVTAALALLLAGVVVGRAEAQVAAGLLPDRRITVEPGVDFYGSDLRSLFGTTPPICRDACLAEGACKAFTFNTAANACFLKSDVGARTAFATALSATLAPQPDGLATRATARAAELGFLPAARLAAARDAALSAGFPREASIAEPVVAADLDALLAEVNRTDAAAAWAGLAAFAAAAAVEDWDQRTRLRDLAVSAGINAYLRAGSDAEAGEAARLTGVALEAAGEGKASLDALRLAERLAPGPAITAALARAEGLYGFRVTDRQVDFEATSPGPALPSPRSSQAPASSMRTSSASTPGPSQSRRATASSASTASPTAAVTRSRCALASPPPRASASAPRSSRRSMSATAPPRCASLAAPMCCRRARRRRFRSSRSTPGKPR